jgi:hypothetical protein
MPGPGLPGRLEAQRQKMSAHPGEIRGFVIHVYHWEREEPGEASPWIKLIEGRFDKMLQENLKKVKRLAAGGYVQIPVLDIWCLVEEVAAYKPTACRAIIAQISFEI